MFILCNSFSLFQNESFKPEISSSSSGKANSNEVTNQLRGPVELSPFATSSICKTCLPNTGPRVTASYSFYYKGLYDSEY